MNDELKQKLVESLGKVQEYVEATEEFVSEQAPLVVQEIITLGRVESTWAALCPMVVCVVSLTIALIFIRRALAIFRGKREPGFGPANGDTPGEPTMIAGVVSAVVSVVSFVIALCTVPGLFEPWIAPRVYLLNELRNLL